MIPRLFFKPRRDTVIGKLRLIPDDSGINGRLHNPAVIAHEHLHDDRQAVLVFIQRTQVR